MFECLVKTVNDYNYRQPSLALLFSMSEEKAPVLCNHSEFNIENSQLCFLEHYQAIQILNIPDPKQ